MNELELIPYKTSPLPEGPWLVFAPHCDDETFGMGGSLILAAKADIKTNVVVLTDGALGGDNSDGKLVQRRQLEAKQATDILGTASVQFLNLQERELRLSTDLVNRVRELVRQFSPRSVFFPSVHEFHPDHRNCAAVIWAALHNFRDYKVQAFSYEISVQLNANYFVDISEVVAKKEAAMLCYKSQLAENNYIEVVQALNKTRTYTLPRDVCSAEAFRLHSDLINASINISTIVSARALWQLPTSERGDVDRELRPCISVIVRTKDRIALLTEALLSVAVQTYPEIELVVVNDGGVDVQTIIDEHSSAFSKVVYVNLRTNVGRASASAAGLNSASGEYLMFLDDDDLYDPDHVEQLLNAVVADKEARVAYCGIRAEVNGQSFCFNEPFCPEMLRFRNAIPIHSYIFHRSLIDDGAHIDEDMEVYDDWDFILQLCELTPFKHLNRISATYRAEGDSGFGLSPEPEIVCKGLTLLLGKWCNKWSGSQMKETLIAITKEHMKLNSMIKEMNVAIDNLTKQRLEKEKAFLKINEQILTGRTKVESLYVKQNSMVQHVAELESVNEDLSLELQHALDHCNNLTSSTFWRVTWPLRHLLSLIRDKF